MNVEDKVELAHLVRDMKMHTEDDTEYLTGCTHCDMNAILLRGVDPVDLED